MSKVKVEKRVSEADKLEKLMEVEGYSDVTVLLRDLMFDQIRGVGICMNPGCDYTGYADPDQRGGWCENCETDTVDSALMLAGLM